MLKQRIDQDLKTALLAGDKVLATTLRGLKSVILYAEVAKGARDTGLEESELIELLAKEAKKRQESADLFTQGGNQTQAEAELAEKVVIEKYLPQQIDDDELSQIVEDVVKQLGVNSVQDMGKAIGLAKQKVGVRADGARIAQIVKRMLS